uniref:TNFR-Cys domain-containing protein n=1 Tax=Anopheles dirus TaxID=7168 RepID=A0A182NIU1_9DIPT
MKSLFTLVFLVVCAAQAYSLLLPAPDCAGHHLGYVNNYLNHYYDYPGLPCHGRPHYLPHAPCKTCQGCRSCKTTGSELYPCPYRQHGPCECKE